VITPINWRAKSDEIDFYLSDSQAASLSTRRISRCRQAVTFAHEVCRIAVGIAEPAAAVSLADLLVAAPQDVGPRVSADAWSIMLYTSGTTSKPKGVPRRHSAERAAALAHVAQKCTAGASEHSE